MGCVATKVCLRRKASDLNADPIALTVTAPVPMYEDMAPIVTAAATPVPMYEDMAPVVTTAAATRPPQYEDIDDVHTSTTFSNTDILMEENEAYGRKITM